MGARERWSARRAEFKERHGRVWLIVAAVLVIWAALGAWSNFDFAIGHRSTLAAVGFGALNVIANPWVPIAGFSVVLVWLIWIEFFTPIPATLEAARDEPVPRWGEKAGWSNWIAGHDIDGQEAMLWARSTDATEATLDCRVQDPDGRIYRSLLFPRMPGERTAQGRWQFLYPEDFGDTPELAAPGSHNVRWVAGYQEVLVVEDDFDIPEPPEPEPLEQTQDEPQRQAQPHDPNKEYKGVPIHNVVGEGRYRGLIVGLDDIGNGYDEGVHCEIASPSGRRVGAQWGSLGDPPNRRKVRDQGYGIGASEEGPYTVTWRAVTSNEFEPDVIATETVVLGPTGPLEGWMARTVQPTADEIIFEIEPDSSDRGELKGFQCIVEGPGGQFFADDRALEKERGETIGLFGLPTPKPRGRFVYPKDFEETTPVRDLHDGEYQVYWTAWDKQEDGSLIPIDVARGTFRMGREGFIESE